MLELECPAELRAAALAALDAAGVDDGHLSVEFVDADRIRELNREHRAIDEPTDVLSFPVDEAGPAVGPRELGDVVICFEQAERQAGEAGVEIRAEVRTLVVHGLLHLLGHDHETDGGVMLARQDELSALLPALS